MRKYGTVDLGQEHCNKVRPVSGDTEWWVSGLRAIHHKLSSSASRLHWSSEVINFRSQDKALIRARKKRQDPVASLRFFKSFAQAAAGQMNLSRAYLMQLVS